MKKGRLRAIRVLPTLFSYRLINDKLVLKNFTMIKLLEISEMGFG